MNRPPPLQLRLDNRFPNFGLKQSKPFLAKVYDVNWRPLVLALATINALRFALLASNAFHDQVVDSEEQFPNLARISFTLGVMYLFTCLVEGFGFFASLFARPCLVRMYKMFAVLSLLLATATGVIFATGYFAFAEDIVAECVQLSTTGRMDTRSLFRSDAWHRSYNIPIPAGQAQSQCLTTWHSESISEVLSVLCFSLFPSTICFLIIWTWSGQTQDPNHVAYLGLSTRSCGICCGCCDAFGRWRGRRSAIRMEEYSPIYQPLSSQVHTPHSHHLSNTARTTVQARAFARPTMNNAMNRRPPPSGGGGGGGIIHINKKNTNRKSKQTNNNRQHNTRRRVIPPPLALALPGAAPGHVPQMAQVPTRHNTRPSVVVPTIIVSASENFQTMSPLTLDDDSASASPYGVSPGPPSFDGGGARHSYAYTYNCGPEAANHYQYQYHHQQQQQHEPTRANVNGGLAVAAAHGQPRSQEEEEEVQQVRRGRGEYWFV